MLPLQLLVDARLVTAEHASRVVAPAYDALDAAGRRQHIATNPESFLAALPTGGAPSTGFGTQRRALHRLHERGRFRALPGPALLVLELTEGATSITTVVVDVDVEAFLDGRIRPHEHVRADRVAELAGYLTEVRAASSPVCVLHRRHPDLDAVVAEVQEQDVDLDAALTAQDRVRVWVVTEPATRRRLARAAAEVEDATVADGHHRAAAVARRVGPDAVHAAHRPGVAGPVPLEQHRLVLTALVAGDDLQIAAFHRRIDGLGPVTVDEVRAVLHRVGLTTRPLPGPALPATAGTVHLAVAGSWLSVDIHGERGDSLRDRLDVAIAERHVVAPLATLADGPHPAEIVPVPGPAGLAALQREDSVGVALVPPTLGQILAITSAGGVLPHKSTYLRPKLRSGILTVPR